MVPLPLRPLSSVTSMSNFATTAVSATSIVAISCLEPLTTTFFTVMPPGSVVPETRNFGVGGAVEAAAVHDDVEADGALGRWRMAWPR